MTSAAIENLKLSYPKASFVFFASPVSVALYEDFPNLQRSLVSAKKGFLRILNLKRLAKDLGEFDIALSFRSSLASSALLYFLKAKKKFKFKKDNSNLHQVQKYENFVIKSLNLKLKFDELKLYFTPFKFKNKTLGINPGATYGSAKRWYPSYFSEVAKALSGEFEIIIFGGKGEQDIAADIANELEKSGVKFKNLCGKTSVKELCELISGLDLFITNDSGPMHIAAAYKVPTVALFGPTKLQTAPYKNNLARIARLNLKCMPCMKRVCPIKTHACMRDLTPKMVLEIINELMKTENI